MSHFITNSQSSNKMASRLDVIIFGVTGFTGMHTLRYIHKLAKSNGRSLTWGVSGRSEEKVKQVLEKMGAKIGVDFSDIPIIIADIKNDASLKAMAEKAKVVVNACGPYRFLGESVVKACIAAGTHHVDVSGEPQFMERMQLENHKLAEEKGVYVVSACGFDSIPTDLGVVFLQQQFEGTLNSVETYLTSWQEKSDVPVKGSSVNYGTWESAVYGLAHADELKGLRTKLYPTRLPKFEPALPAKTLPHKPKILEGWAVPFLGSDRSVVRRSQRYFYDSESKRPVQIETYLAVKAYWHLLILGFYGMIFGILARFDFGRKLLLDHPKIFSGGFFSKEQPSEESIEKSWFAITMYGEGWSERLAGRDDKYTTPVNKSIVAKIKGRNPGYGATCIALVLAAIMIITENDKMPGKGGVFPPGAAFAKTSLIKELNENEVTFEVISQKDL